MLKFYLNGYLITPPKEWQDIEIIASFESSIQPNINIDSFTFVNDAKKLIEIWVSTFGFFEGMPFEIAFNEDNYTGSIPKYSGLLDFVGGYEIINPMEIKVKIKQLNGLNLIDERVKAISYGYLAQKGEIKKTDYINVPVIVKKKIDAVEVVMVSMSLYFITKEIIEFAEKNGSKTIDSVMIILSAPLQKPATIFKAVAQILLTLIYTAAMLIAILNLTKVLRQNLIPRKTNYKGLTLRKALELACGHFGYSLDCDIEDLNYFTYLPSKVDDKIRLNKKDDGIPNPSDYGYNVSEMFDLVFKLFNAKPKIDNNTIVIRNETSQYWVKQSTYTMPNVLVENSTFNLDDLVANRLIKFQFDPSDEYTMPTKYNGHDYENKTIVEVITDFHASEVRHKLNRGLDEINIPLALGERREKLSVFEEALKGLFFGVDLIIKLFGGTTIKENIDSARGNLLISHNNFNVAKLIYIKEGKIPSNHLDNLSAKAIYDKYYKGKSFVTNSEFMQRQVFKNVIIPFKFSDFIKLINNSYFTTSENIPKIGKFTRLHYKLDSDVAICDYWIANKYIQDGKLYETIIEA